MPENINQQNNGDDNNDIDQDDINDNQLANINFILLKNGLLQLECEWLYKSTKTAIFFSKFIHHIVSGEVIPSIIQHLNILQQNNIKDTKFYETILKEFDNIKHVYESNPLIKPSQVFKEMTQ